MMDSRNMGRGFLPQYQDPTGQSQVYHFWEFVAIGFANGRLVSDMGNAWHEFNAWRNGEPGASWQDLNLGGQGAYLGGYLLGNRYMDFYPSQVPEWIATHLANRH
jgi:hypothetical protein